MSQKEEDVQCRGQASVWVIFPPRGTLKHQNPRSGLSHTWAFWRSGHGAELYGLFLQIEEAGWSYVGGWTGQGGSKLGTKR